LRHSAGTTTAAHFNLEAAKEFLGHASIKTTEQYYVAPLPELAAEVARKIG
jgi:integrase